MIEISLWKPEIKTLFLQDIMSTVWVDGGKAGTKGSVVVHTLSAESISVGPASTRVILYDTKTGERSQL